MQPPGIPLSSSALFRPRPFSFEDYVADRPVSRRGRLQGLELPRPFTRDPSKQVWTPYGFRDAEPGLDRAEEDAQYDRQRDEPYLDSPRDRARPAPAIMVEDEEAPEAEAEEAAWPAVGMWPTATDLTQEDPLAPEEGGEKQQGMARSSSKVRRDAEKPRRLGRSAYDAMETHGHFGLVDGGEQIHGNIRKVILHVPKRNRGYALDVKQGDIVYANGARGNTVGGRLEIAYVSRHRYVSPGHAVTSCVVGIPNHQWRRFVE